MAAPAAYHLPAELLAECLRAANPRTRVRASHVSRRWRAVALADRRLWDSFSCSNFRDELHREVMFDELQAMLLRSNPLPFQLRIPHRYCGGTISEYHDRLLSMKHFDIGRLSLYVGSAVIFSRINSHGTPLHALTSLDVRENRAFGYPRTIVILDGEFSSRILVNLRILHAHYISFSSHSAPFQALRDLTCSVGYAFNYEKLFNLCPNLVHVQFNDLDVSTRLPPLSLPRSLQSITLRAEQGFTLGVPELLHNWTLVRLPRLVVHDVDSLQGILPRFLTVHQEHRVELRLHSCSCAITLSTMPDDGASVCAWMITPTPICPEFLGSLDTRGCPRLTALSVSLEQLGRLFLAKLQCPGLERLQFSLNGAQRWPLLQADEDDLSLCAPRLQHVVFSANDERADMDEIHRVLGVMRASFRALIVYDAELLESITLSAPAAWAQEMDCADFAHFAKEYLVQETI